MASITANTSTIRSTASDIVTKAKAYKGAFDEMYAKIRALRATWTSEDGNAYIAKIESYYEDFNSMYGALNKAANSLEADAAAYENTVKANMV
jgi:WXG100 family type VII secretion target